MSRRILDLAIVLLAAAILLIVALGGIDYDWGIVRIRLHDWVRPTALLAIAIGARGLSAVARSAKADARGARGARGAGAGGATGAGGAGGAGPLFTVASYVATRGLVALLITIAAVYATYQVRVCGGLDSYGYVSTAGLIASGRLIQPQPLVQYLPFEGASSAVAPLGYVAGPGGNTEVPRFPLGMPLVMAAFMFFGSSGPFFVPLVMAYVMIGVAFLLGGGLGSRAEARPHVMSARPHVMSARPRVMWGWPSGQLLTGLFAAAVVAVDPLVADYAMQPMSDVPATCWLLAAIWLRIGVSGGSTKTRPAYRDPAILAGMCAGMAFLTRPALLVAAIAIGVVTLDRPFKETVRFGATLLAFVALQMVINQRLYGSIGLSGYGPASYMFELSSSRLMANVSNFGKWLTHSHTPIFWLLWPGALLVLRHHKAAWQISAVAAAALAPYLFYLVFDDWEASRFVLPAIVPVLVLAAVALSVIIARLGPPFAVALLVIALGCAAASHRFLQREGVYEFGNAEAKYALAGEWIRTRTPERAVFLAGLHSGSIRYYGLRPTIRWDQIPSDMLSPTLHNLEAAGYEPYLALDLPSEPPLFTERFRSDSSVEIEQIARIRVVSISRFVSAP